MESLAADDVATYQPGGMMKNTQRSEQNVVDNQSHDGGMDEEVLTDMSSEDDYHIDHQGNRVKKVFQSEAARKLHK